MSDEDTKCWIYSGGLPYDLTEGDIICVFSQFGEIFKINLSRDKETGKSKGFCFIRYEDYRSCELAVDNLNGVKIIGRAIKVHYANNSTAIRSMQSASVAPHDPDYKLSLDKKNEADSIEFDKRSKNGPLRLKESRDSRATSNSPRSRIFNDQRHPNNKYHQNDEECHRKNNPRQSPGLTRHTRRRYRSPSSSLSNDSNESRNQKNKRHGNHRSPSTRHSDRHHDKKICKSNTSLIRMDGRRRDRSSYSGQSSRREHKSHREDHRSSRYRSHRSRDRVDLDNPDKSRRRRGSSDRKHHN